MTDWRKRFKGSGEFCDVWVLGQNTGLVFGRESEEEEREREIGRATKKKVN